MFNERVLITIRYKSVTIIFEVLLQLEKPY